VVKKLAGKCLTIKKSENMKTIKISNQWLFDNGYRLDSKFHAADGRLYSKKLEKSGLNIEELNTITNRIFNGPRFIRCYINNRSKGTPFLSSSDIIRTDLSNLK